VNRPPGDIPLALRTAEVPGSAPGSAEAARVLLVDDDERNLLAVATVLEDLGEVVLARSGEEALRHLLKGEFAVILLDVYMPGMDGYETAQIIRSREQTKGIPIVFLSAVNKEAEHLLRGYSMGAVDYVFKPVDPIILRSKVSVFVELFDKSKEVERKARHEQALLEENIRANTELLRIERELRFAEARQAAIIQALPIVLYVEEPEAAVRSPQYVAGNFEALTGFTREHVESQPDIFMTNLHPDDHAAVVGALEQRLRTGTMSIEYRWRCADGKYRHFVDQTVELAPENGRRRFAGSFMDISDRRELESQLVQAQKMDAIGKLTGGIAHDFNNLLAAVIGGLGLIEKRAKLPAEQQRILAMTKRAAEQGSELVRRLLAFARRQRLEPRPVDLGALQGAVLDLLTHTLGGLVNLEWDVAQDIWPVFADQAQLELALLNLIINARDAMPDGGTVTILAANREVAAGALSGLEAGEYVCITVEDTGTGISADDLQKVMEPFFTTKEVGKGSGLGLSMVYGFVEQSGGRLRIESQPGQGTRVELLLPTAAAVEETGETGSPDGLSPGHARVLVVEDEAGVRKVAVRFLRSLGYDTLEAGDAAQALDLLHGDPGIRLLFSDVVLGNGHTGFELVRDARLLRPGLPALLTSGYERSAIGADEALQGGVELLRKPYRLEQLGQALAKALEDGPA
jgi:PAS domain S-box-containing protein